MKQVSSWMGLLTVAFWGTLIIGLLARNLAPESTRFMAQTSAPPVVIVAGVTLLVYLRRRARRQQKAPSLEEIRRQSRQRLAGEPAEDAHVVLASRTRHRHRDGCEEGQEGHGAKEHPDAPKPQAKETHE